MDSYLDFGIVVVFTQDTATKLCDDMEREFWI